MRPFLPFLLVTSACLLDDPSKDAADDSDAPETDLDSDLPADTDPAPDTDVPDDTDPPDDTDVVPRDTDGGDIWYHVVLVLQALPAGQGFDVDGDGDVDNALGGAAAVINPLIADNYGSTHQYALTQLWGVDTDDDLADVGILGGRDTDEDPSDNPSGTEVFRLIGALTPDDHAPLYAPTTVDPTSGAYTATFAPGLLTFGTFQIPIATPIQARGTLTAAAHDGQLGGAVRLSDLTPILQTFGVGWIGTLLAGLADIDTDGNGTLDAVSVAFAFDAVACELEIP